LARPGAACRARFQLLRIPAALRALQSGRSFSKMAGSRTGYRVPKVGHHLGGSSLPHTRSRSQATTMSTELTRREMIARTGICLGAAAAPAGASVSAAERPRNEPASEPFGYCLNMGTIMGHKLSLAEEVEVAAKAGWAGRGAVDSQHPPVRRRRRLVGRRQEADRRFGAPGRQCHRVHALGRRRRRRARHWMPDLRVSCRPPL